MSRRVSATEQGQLQGANASLVGIANMIGPAIFTTTYARAISPEHEFQSARCAVSCGGSAFLGLR